MPGHASHKDLVGLVVFSMTIAAAPGRRPPVLVVLLLRLLLLLRLIFTIVTFHVCHTASLCGADELPDSVCPPCWLWEDLCCLGGGGEGIHASAPGVTRLFSFLSCPVPTGTLKNKAAC